jgi:hypothetical protein
VAPTCIAGRLGVRLMGRIGTEVPMMLTSTITPAGAARLKSSVLAGSRWQQVDSFAAGGEVAVQVGRSGDRHAVDRDGECADAAAVGGDAWRDETRAEPPVCRMQDLTQSPLTLRPSHRKCLANIRKGLGWRKSDASGYIDRAALRARLDFHLRNSHGNSTNHCTYPMAKNPAHTIKFDT